MKAKRPKKTDVEKITTEWEYTDGDPNTPEGARHFAAMMKQATGRDVRATFVDDIPGQGVTFSVQDIDRDAETERKERAIAAYRETYAEAVAAGITKATPPDAMEYTFAANVADEADEIEQAGRDLRAAIEKQAWDKAQAAEAAAEIESTASKRAGEIIATAARLCTATSTNGTSATEKPKQKKPGRKPLTPEQIKKNRKRNEFITELRRRADTKGGIGDKGLSAAYDELETEADKAGSKWRTIIGLAPRTAYIDKARHNKHYKT